MENRRSFVKKMATGVISVPLIKPSSFFEDKKLNVALVGLGRYANYMAEGIAVSKYCKVNGIVTGTPSKIPVWRKKYNIPEKNVYNYETFDQIADNKDIDVVYVILPNGMHKEYVIRAARAGKHVIVEKPMAISAAECEEMIEGCHKAGVQLAVGYRLHFEPYNQHMMKLGQEKVYGEVRYIEAGLGYNSTNIDPSDWHLNPELSGGGCLQNLGVYCVQGARYVTGLEPVAITARFGEKLYPDVFKEVEESIHWSMEFANGTIASCVASSSFQIDRLFASAENNFFELSPAISYGPFQGRTRSDEFDFPQTNQQQVQMDEMAKYLLNKKTLPDHICGLEGLKDLRVIDAVYEAARSGKRVAV
ncbi:Gfo/Idh/MocA family protein [Jiulongibacter sediminis]|uniref:Glucose-fructose oxidoreductase n=1 Tax=Jiulongibacter sediminis TaxID=1605367 RepID=A0A0P7BYU3_9BACT|nr:Gfo/Idh/MocA family oxidoreductase [Jiulongibacter sediminis]KPM49670.1 glucose-fructose oxidoreductase [Jiulongibacter sediminis]TBX26708.1 glucose-fructose oxidoreductase [Jiulongibacter sediminis]